MPARTQRRRHDKEKKNSNPDPNSNPNPNRVQKLYDACRDAFVATNRHESSSSASPLLEIARLLDSIKPEDVGLADGEHFVTNQATESSEIIDTHPSNAQTPTVSYFGIHDCKEFSIGIFGLSESAVIPLHDHPGMTVLSKLLYGSMHVKAYDWIEPSLNTNPSQYRLARLVRDEVISAPCEISILYPTHGGNIHTFTATSPCAVLDVLVPPYSEEEGRDCTYYSDTPIEALPGGTFEEEYIANEGLGFATLDVVPLNFVVNGMPYRGQPITTY